MLLAIAALAHPVLPSRHRLIQTTPCPRQVRGMRSDAKFILLVEKDAAFMRLAEDRFYNTYPCIIITAKGQPDVATRHVGMACMKAAWTRVVAPKHSARCALVHQRTFLPHPRLFLRKLKMELKIPVLALVDSDPYGLKILSVYMKGGLEFVRCVCGDEGAPGVMLYSLTLDWQGSMQSFDSINNIIHGHIPLINSPGSMNMSYDSSNLTTPDIKWLGVRPSDLERFNIPEQCRLPMSEEDIKTGKKLVRWRAGCWFCGRSSVCMVLGRVRGSPEADLTAGHCTKLLSSSLLHLNCPARGRLCQGQP